MPDAFIHTCGLHHATVLRDVAKEYGQATILGIGMLQRADAAVFAVGIEALPLRVLYTELVAEFARRCTKVDTECLRIDVLLIYIIAFDVFAQRGSIHALAIQVEQSALGQFAKDAKDTSSTSALLHAVLLGIGGQLAETGYLAA